LVTITKKQAIVVAALAIFAAVMFVVPVVMNSPSHQASACWGGCGGWGGGWGGCGGCGGGWGWHHGWWHHGWGWGW